MGKPSFLIDTTHHTHRDYVRHADGALNPKKARKCNFIYIYIYIYIYLFSFFCLTFFLF